VKRFGTIVIATLALGLGACGSNGPGVSQGARNDLNPLVAQVRERAAAHDAVGAERVLATLRRKVNQLEQSNAIGEHDATAIRHAATEVAHRLTLITTTTTTTTTTTVAPPPPPSPPDKHGPGHGPKQGHHKGKEGGDEG